PALWSAPTPELLPPSQRAAIDEANDLRGPLPVETLDRLWEAQVDRSPEAAAVITTARTLSYAELDGLSGALARALAEHAQGPLADALVAVIVDRGWAQCVATLAVVRSGGAYLPIDTSYPADRCLTLLERGGVRLALTNRAFLEAHPDFPWPAALTLLVVEDFDPGPGLAQALRADERATLPRPAPTELAYVIFTSGSTGAPKGVMIEHRAAVNTVVDVNARYGVTPADRVFGLSSLAFDLSVYDLFGMWAVGAAVVAPTEAERGDPERWTSLLAQGQVSVWNTVPSLAQLLVDYAEDHPELAAAMQSLRVIMMSGDWIPIELPDALRRFVPTAQIWSLGGTTEATIWQVDHPIGVVDRSRPSIPYGRPMTNHRIHVLDRWMRPCPMWVPGELFFGGDGVARGYYADPERSAASFVHHPRSGEYFYRSGDFGRWRPDATLEFLGRKDRQVKINGFRIELGEIEARLGSHAAVSEVAVVVVGSKPPRLVAHVAVTATSTEPAALIDALRRHCAAGLPAYMVPAAWQLHDQRLPRSSNAKVDRGALAKLGLPAAASAPASRSATATPATTGDSDRAALLERVVAEAAEALGLSRGQLDPDATFASLGVDSVAALRLRSRLQRALGRPLPATLAYDHPTLRTVVAFLADGDHGEQRGPESASAAVPVTADAEAKADEPIAIVAMACRLPQGVADPEAFWRALIEGRDTTTEVPRSRWDIDAIYDPSGEAPGSSYCRRGGFLGDLAGFDAAFFEIAAREARSLDPQQRLLLEVGWETFERAGLRPRELAGTEVGVYVGLSTEEYRWIEGHSLAEQLDGHGVTGSTPSTASGRLAYSFGLEGPALTVDTACSSSLVTVHLAAQALRAGDCDLALAGGACLLQSPTLFIEFSRLGGLARDGRCKAFSAAADGVGWSEGVGLVLLERLSDARRHGHPILALLHGEAVNQDGRSNGLTAPSGRAQERVIRRALQRAGLAPEAVDYVEAHGTGTKLGDPIEAGALARVFGQRRVAEAATPLWLGSAKSNLGHTLSAAGVAGLMKVVLALGHEQLPPTLHAGEP
ncbi:MAG: amino acid adenylation domain-containing protein, partial [Myxococcales bacterium]|nr:amino acid adenylation domain-containing protein [Myxococcales bacterium]